ncbi:MAG: phosphoribosylamine--glycine ligase [Candidatus Latescibacteria bacterium]|nr:phosphoribosylamine--glycine ligase [Candidatus Latescibacterota bacterium]
MTVLVVGGGGREHALVWKIRQSPLVGTVYAAPGNAGIVEIAECVPIQIEDINRLVTFAIERRVDLTVVGPDDPLALGIVDAFEGAGLRVFGPSKRAAEIESSKVFAKDLMRRYGIPTARYAVFTSPDEATAYIRREGAPIVVKADGLARGKGVVVATTIEEALDAVEGMLVKRVFGSAGESIVIEEYLEGEEASIFAITDGRDVALLVPSQDHKQIYDGDRGPNTGGMGAYAPAPVVTETMLRRIEAEVVRPAVEAMEQEGRPYKGVLYAGVMIGNDGFSVLEFNSRFGDPETQVVLPLMRTDLIEVLLAVCDGTLREVKVEHDHRTAVCVVLASEGYPGNSPKGRSIVGLEMAAAMEGIVVFHAGTARDQDGAIVTNGGRVLGVTAVDGSIQGAIRQAYRAVEAIHFDGMQYRKDIGMKALGRLER